MKILAANFKMNLTLNEINEYIDKIKDIDNKNIVLIPSNIYIPYFLNKKFSVGVQDAYYLDNGAFTGEVSAKQISSLGVNYAIIGHSERRMYFNETNDILNKKILSCESNGLKVIYCIGETKEERESNKTKEVLLKQLDEGLKGASEVIIAYEPRWAIGTNVTPTNEEIEDIISFIKSKYNYKVLYGGSTNDKNIASLNTISNVDGFLVGGASLDYDKFKKMIEIVFCQFFSIFFDKIRQN